MDFAPTYLLSIGISQGPGLALGALAIVLALVRPLPPGARKLLVLGGCALVGSRLSAIFWQLALPRVAISADYPFIPVARAFSYIPTLIELAGIGLLIAAALTGRSMPPPEHSAPTGQSEPH